MIKNNEVVVYGAQTAELVIPGKGKIREKPTGIYAIRVNYKLSTQE